MPHPLPRWRRWLSDDRTSPAQNRLENHRHNGSLSVVRDFHCAASKLDSTVCKGGEHHHAIRKLHGSRMRSGKIVDIAANAVSKILTGSGQVKVKSWHDHTPLKARC
jgi:hypothetical protein